jgi:hypothetical protein
LIPSTPCTQIKVHYCETTIANNVHVVRRTTNGSSSM